MYCEYCGNKLEAGEKFCNRCGKSVMSASATLPSSQTGRRGYFRGYRIAEVDLFTAEKHIKNAWIAALISAGVTALFVLFGVLDVWSWIDVALILLFAFGIYRKNRIAAIGMFIYFLITKLLQFGGITSVENASFGVGSVIVALALLNYFYLGMIGVIRFQQLVPKEQRRRGAVFGAIVGSLATLFIVFLLVGMLPEEATPQDIILEADYQEGYKAGYVDGRASQANLGDSYVQIATEERRDAYDLGYLVGFSEGCKEGGFDCNEVEQVIKEALDEANLPTDGSIQLIPSTI